MSSDKLVVRIGDRNVASVTLFRKLGFEVRKHVEVFGELEMRLSGTPGLSNWKAGALMKLE